jgi:hypothetical protein
MPPAFTLRLATEDDIPSLHALIEASVRGLQANDYTPAQIEGALGTVLGLDTQLIRDKTYFLAEFLLQNSRAHGVPLRVGDGRSGKPSLAPIAGRAVSPNCLIPQPTLPRYAPSSCILTTRGKVSAR